MTLCELQEYIKNQNINLKDIRIILGEKLNISNAEEIYSCINSRNKAAKKHGKSILG